MKKPMAPAEASPYKSVAEELERLRKTFRSLSQRYTSRVESEITALRDVVLAEAGPVLPVIDVVSDSASDDATHDKTKPLTARRPPSKAQAAKAARQMSQFHDLRDMLTLLRTFEVTAGVARRKDLKRVESLVEELQLFARHWT